MHGGKARGCKATRAAGLAPVVRRIDGRTTRWYPAGVIQDDDDAPEGFLFELPGALAKAPAAAPPVAMTPSAAQEAELQKAARALSSAPSPAGHGRPAGAGNALAFHAWRKDGVRKGGDPAPDQDADAPKGDGSR